MNDVPMPYLRQRLRAIATQALFGALSVWSVTPAHAGFPLSTEDTGTLGDGRSKLEWTGEWGRERENGAREMASTHELTVAHGLLRNLNGFINVPYRDVRTGGGGVGSARVHGLGDIRLGMKWRYFEQDRVNLGLKAVLSVPTGDDSAQLGSGKATQSVNMIAAYEAGPWEFDLDIGYKRNANTLNQRERLGSISGAVVRSLENGWTVMADMGVASNKNRQSSQLPAYLGAGVSYAATKSLELNAGVKRGLTAAETDFTGLAGVVLRF